MGVLSKLLNTLSGNNNLKVSEQLLFDKVIGFRSIVPGCGASLVLQNTAIAISETTRFNVCVLDTNFLYPVQYPLLCSTELSGKGKEPDILDYAGDLAKVVRNSSYPNIYVVQLEHRTVIDMLSGKDTESGIVKLMAALKSYFDIILVDLSHELTNTNIHAAIKCNKIIHVADTSFKCLYNIKKSLNTVATLGVPLAKCNKVIVNKELENVVLGVDNALTEAGLKIIGHIPLSMDVAIYSASAKRIYGAMSREKGISAFNVVIDNLLEDLLEKSPLNSEYFNVSAELKRIESMQKMEKVDDDIVEDYSGQSEVEIEEYDDIVDDSEDMIENSEKGYVEDNVDSEKVGDNE